MSAQRSVALRRKGKAAARVRGTDARHPRRMEPEELSEHVERDDAAFEEQTKMVRRSLRCPHRLRRGLAKPPARSCRLAPAMRGQRTRTSRSSRKASTPSPASTRRPARSTWLRRCRGGARERQCSIGHLKYKIQPDMSRPDVCSRPLRSSELRHQYRTCEECS